MNEPMMVRPSRMGKIGLALIVFGALVFLAGAATFVLHWVIRDFRTATLVFGIIGLALGGAMLLTGSILAAVGKKSTNRDLLRQTGLAGKGEIVSVARTHVVVNYVPQYQFEVRVSIAGKDPYLASCRMTVDAFQASRLTTGAVLDVRVDPRNPENFVFQ